ncbi:hypothetical protein A2706_05340 [Candidatus Peribacteria bacterium RIFCSPHIGHO2_01_FULL_51_35]|nr:MAG: hypothetical protein A2706_05340 [Candidatus Peribacteria bacterium RIFCSPHIGHO2_01_FULL_51_35]
MRIPKKILVLASVLFLVWSSTSGFAESLLSIPVVHAAGLNEESQALMSWLAFALSILITGMNLLMWILFRLLDIVLDPFFIFDLKEGGGDGPLLSMLHTIWQLTRDLMNVIFAILLVVGAVMTIIKTNTELVKNYRAKFVLAVVLINFSWFIPRVILDVSQVLTYTVYQIPSLLEVADVTCRIPSDDPAKPAEPCRIVDDVKFFEETEKITPDDPATPAPRWVCPLSGLVCFHESPFDAPETWDHNAVINGLIINHARLAVLAQVVNPRAGGAVAPEDKSDIREMLMFIMRIVLVFIIHIALFFPILALVLAFFIRIPILWITMAFMPVAVMGFVIGDKIPGFNPWEKIGKLFLTAAFLPAMVAIPFTVGFVMINAGVNTPIPPGFAKLDTALPLLAGVKDIWQLMWMILAIVVLWIGVFMVLKQNEIIGKVTEPIGQYGKNFGKLALKAPLALPFLPVGGGMSPLQAFKSLDPRRWNQDLDDNGRWDGSSGRGGDPEKMAKTRASINKDGLAPELKGKIADIARSTVAADRKRLLNDLVTALKIKTKDAEIKLLTPDQIVEALSHRDFSSEAHGKALRQALVDSKAPAAPVVPPVPPVVAPPASNPAAPPPGAAPAAVPPAGAGGPPAP